MEYTYHSSRHYLLFLILQIICMKWIISIADANNTVTDTAKCCENDDNSIQWSYENNVYNFIESNSDENSKNAIDLLQSIVNKHESNWIETIQKSNTTCKRILLNSLLTSARTKKALSTLNTETSTSSQAKQNPLNEVAGNLNEYLLFCNNATLNAINGFGSRSKNNKPIDNILSNDEQITNNINTCSAIVLRDVRLNMNDVSRHLSQMEYSNNENIHRKQLVTIENTTEYLSWIKSDLNSKLFSGWMQQQKQINKQNSFIYLTYLDLSQNQMENLTWIMLESTPNLRVLNLSQNVIDSEHLSCNIFQRLTKLQRLILSNNQFKSIAYERLHDLLESGEIVNSIDLSSMPPNIHQTGFFMNMPELCELDLSHNQITDLPRNAFDTNGLPKLRYLNIAYNQLSIIPFQIFRTLNALEVLNLSSNRLVRIIDNFFIGNLALRYLNLRNNSIEMLSKSSLYNLNNLIELDLSNNYITIIDRNAFDSLEALQLLNLRGNHLTMLPTTLFYQLRQLKCVNLSKNNFKILPNGIFANQFALEMLIIDETAIHKTNNWVSRNIDDINKDLLKNLRFISMRNNHHLREIDSITFRNLPAVEYLNLSGNSLTVLPHEIGELNELKHLDLSNNDLISVPRQLNTLRKLETISLIGNNYACDCQMVWLTKWIANARSNATNNTSIEHKAPFNQLNYLKCRQGYPGDFLRVLEQQHCFQPIAVHVSESKTYLLRSDAQLECSFRGNPVPDIIWVTPLNKIIRHYADPDAKQPNALAYTSQNSNDSNDNIGNDVHGMYADAQHQAKNREKIEYQILKQKKINFTAATEANGVTLLENGSLRVHNISRKDSGLYICYGYNVMGYASADIR